MIHPIIKSLVLFLFIATVDIGYSQETIFSDNCKCGFKVVSYKNVRSTVPGQFDVQIPSNAVLKYALLITNLISIDSLVLEENFSLESKLGNQKLIHRNNNCYTPKPILDNKLNGVEAYRVSSMYDVKSIIENKSSIIISPPESNTNLGRPSPTTDVYYLIIIYENDSLPNKSISIVDRQKPITPNLEINLEGLVQPINYLNPVIVSINSSHLCHTDSDGSYVNVNDSTIGLIGGQEPNAAFLQCSGVQGEFQYDGNIMQALGDDTLNNNMNNTDGVANIAPYLNPNGANFLSFRYQSPQLSYASKTNPIHQLVFAYTSTCPEIPLEVEEQNDVCEGDFLQFEATGAEEYQWEPQVGLSCYDCPNPIVTTDSSRVWRLKAIVDDSCFVVRPVQVHVRKLGFGFVETLPSICAEQTGQIEIAQPNHHIQALSYSLNGGAQTTSNSTGHTFQNISSGTYTLTQHNGGCTFDTTIVIADSQIVIADFVPSPESGAIPFNCYFKDLSTFSTDLTWFVDGEVISEDFYTHRFEEAGEHEVILIAHRKDSLCADTASMFVLAYEDIFISLPNIITANGDGINDELLVRSNQPANLQYSIVNRWGNTVHQGELEINKEEPLSLWTGGDLNEGTYFLKVIATPTVGYAQESRSFETFFRLER